MPKYEKQMQADYGLTQEEFDAIVQTAQRVSNLAYDFQTGEYCATTLAEAIADTLSRWEWLDEPTHPIWDVAAELADAWERERR